ncbi:MAG: hypothetical protein ACOVP1_06850 [Bacteroidia bacterium]
MNQNILSNMIGFKSFFCLNSPTGTSSEVMLSYALIIGVCLLILGISSGIKWIRNKLKKNPSLNHEMPQLPK